MDRQPELIMEGRPSWWTANTPTDIRTIGARQIARPRQRCLRCVRNGFERRSSSAPSEHSSRIRPHRGGIAFKELATRISVERRRTRRSGSAVDWYGRPPRTSGAQLLGNIPLFRIVGACGGDNERTQRADSMGLFLVRCSRLVYLPLYSLGVFLVRSLVWNVAAGGMRLT
jgi:hypothetical protein